LPLNARGAREREKVEPQNAEYVLLITALDVSSLSASQRVLGPILQRELVRDLARIHHRLRSGEEISRYEEMAWIAAVRDTAAKLAAKREERDTLLYQSLPRWKYRKELRRIDKEIPALEEACNKAEVERPFIEGRPLFKISPVNIAGDGSSGQKGEVSFPPPPEPGGEEAFLRSQDVDAFLMGKVRFLYGRVYTEFRVVTRGASFWYEDSTIFSQEDLNAAADEIKSRFMAALAGSEPARLVLRAEPEKAQIRVNGRMVENGGEVEVPPGPVNITVSADEYREETIEAELEGGDKEEYSIALRPLTMEKVGVNLPGPNSSVYMGARYAGGNRPPPREPLTNGTTAPKGTAAVAVGAAVMMDTAAKTLKTRESPEKQGPFEVRIPAGEYRYVRLETEDGLTGEVIIRGAARDGGEPRIVTMKPRKLPGKDDKPVEVKRRKFYGAYGRFWIALPAAFLLNGIAMSYINTYNTTGSPGILETAQTLSYVSQGAWVVTGVFLAESLLRMGIYIHTASKESVPLWK
jgi:hypothetical protein